MAAAGFIFLTSKIYVKEGLLGEAIIESTKNINLHVNAVPHFWFDKSNILSTLWNVRAVLSRSAGSDNCNRSEIFIFTVRRRDSIELQNTNTGCRNVSEMLQIFCRFDTKHRVPVSFLFCQFWVAPALRSFCLRCRCSGWIWTDLYTSGGAVACS
jgi:hypothetical protein